MREFHFRAPTLFDASVKSSVEDELTLHDSRGTAEHLAKFKKLALWLKSEMVNAGLAADGPGFDEGGSWMIQVPSNDGAFVLCTVSASGGDDPRFVLLVDEFGGAPEDVGHVIEKILRNAREIGELRNIDN